MLKGLFKKKKKVLTSIEAGMVLVRVIYDKVFLNWDEKYKEQIDEYLGEMSEIEYSYVPFEIVVAVASLELAAIKNLSPEFYTTVEACLIGGLADTDELEGYVERTIKEVYTPCLSYAIENKLHPVEELISILAEKISYRMDVFSGVTLMAVVMSNVGNWKIILEEYEVKD